MNRGTQAALATMPLLRGLALEPAGLSEAARIDALVAVQQLIAWAEAQNVRLLAAMDVGTELKRDLAATEVGVALREPPALVHDRLRVAHELASRLPAALALLESGAIGYRHARTLADAVYPLSDEIAAKVQAEVLGRAARQPVAAFRRAVHKAVLSHDPRGAGKRHEDAFGQRRVCARPVGDGMAELWALLPADGLAILMARLDAEAAARPPGDERSVDQRRADALVRLAEQGLLDGAGPARHGRKPVLQVTVAASTLLGLDQRPGELEGYGPIPAPLARAIAADPTGQWRRPLTDDDGRLIDYSQTRYRPAPVLQDFVLARDRTCRFPGCSRPARACHIDHLIPWPQGATAACNCEALCQHHHRLKHQGGWHVAGDSNGVLTWTSPTGHKYESPPADYG